MCNRCYCDSNIKMSATGNETLERIQREIQENLEKEEEWKRELLRQSSVNINGNGVMENNNNNVPKPNGIYKKQQSEPNSKSAFAPFARYVQTKGMMHRFLKSKGKVATSNQVSNNFNNGPKMIINDLPYQPPRVTNETGVLTRNGFVPAEVKMRKEVQEFQQREVELRKERRKSQPELMAFLKLEDEVDEGFPEHSCSSSTSSASEMKSAKSLADLCNTSEEELEAPGTFNLIKQFESLKK